MSYIWSAVGEADIAALARRAADALPPGGLALVHDFMVDDAREGPPFAAWYLLGSVLDNPTAVCLTPAYVERVLRDAGLTVESTETMLPGNHHADQSQKTRVSEFRGRQAGVLQGTCFQLPAI